MDDLSLITLTAATLLAATGSPDHIPSSSPAEIDHAVDTAVKIRRAARSALNHGEPVFEAMSSAEFARRVEKAGRNA